MKFFTWEWWCEQQPVKPTEVIDGEEYSARFDPSPWEEGQALLERYVARLNEIDDQLPSCAEELFQLPLHDAQIQSVDHDEPEKQVVMVLQGVCYPHDDDEELACEIRIVYSGVIEFVTSPEADRPLPGPLGYGELGFAEIGVNINGDFEHRMLFSSGREIRITCENAISSVSILEDEQ